MCKHNSGEGRVNGGPIDKKGSYLRVGVVIMFCLDPVLLLSLSLKIFAEGDCLTRPLVLKVLSLNCTLTSKMGPNGA
jgi:hypothetical protein